MTATFRRRLPAALALTAALVALAGCGGGQEAAPMSDVEGVEQFFASLDDLKENPKTLARYFAPPAPPAAELKKYAKLSYAMDGAPTMAGGDVTVKVKITGPKGEAVGAQEWKLVKDGVQWKLKAAPLP